ncbi:MAG TPA: 30S ribosomal protein S27ae [Candidatus Saccharimonadales bacterium]|nr:30S ribosomal protein S27ae [Candidatus Saccharimonadales bacterium]
MAKEAKGKKSAAEFKAAEKMCPKCGVRMANHADRFSCGKCGLTEWKKKGD